ncbi:hypothetical protein LCGC14_2527970, partial [marine sediment metagenome]
MVLVGGAGQPLSTGAVDNLQKQRRQLTGRRTPSRRPRTRFGQRFESERNKERWLDRFQEIIDQKRIQQELIQQQRLAERAKQISLRDL